MPHLLFKLNGVEEDEVIEIRRLLDEHHINYYETHAGLLGVSLAAIWMRDEDDPHYAQELIDGYQQRRTQEARQRYELQLQNGEADTLIQRLMRHPLRMLLYLLIIVVVLYFSVMPFLMLMRGS